MVTGNTVVPERLTGVGEGEELGGGQIWRKGGIEHRTRDPVTLHQRVRQREREVWTQKVWRPLLKSVIRLVLAWYPTVPVHNTHKCLALKIIIKSWLARSLFHLPYLFMNSPSGLGLIRERLVGCQQQQQQQQQRQ
jgi:hypothetical protein